MSNWTITKLAGHCGARLTGISLESASQSAISELHSALFEHGVVTLPGQHLSPQAHIALAETFGRIDINRFFTPVLGHPQIAEVRTSPDQTNVVGGTWHTDHSYDPAPAMCSILNAQELPPYGGDTHFASMTAATSALSPGLRDMLSGLQAWHSDESYYDSNVGLTPTADAIRGATLHPVIAKHPQTGLPCLYVNGDFTTHFEGWTREESAPLLHYLYRFATQPIFTARVVWEPGMLAIWDNRLVQHYATADYTGHARLMHRITVEGTPLEAAQAN